MKFILIAALAALSLQAQQQQEAKNDPPTTKPPEAQKLQDRPLTPLEISDSKLLKKTVDLEQARIAESKRLITDAQNAYADMVERACISIGVAADKWQTECGFSNGLGQDDKQLIDQSGRAVPAHVWKLPPAPVAAPAKP